MRSSDDPDLKRNRFPYRLLMFAFPLHVWVAARFEARMALVRLTRPRRDRRFKCATDLLVNVGCGETGRLGWVNIDGCSAEGVNCVADIRRDIPLFDASARAIFSEHLVEHLDYDEDVPQFLSECLRVLQPGGCLRIVVPDGERYLEAYRKGTPEAFAEFCTFGIGNHGQRTRMEIVNAHFRQGGQHRFSWDEETLVLALSRAGFAEARRSRFGTSRVPELAQDSEARAAESLYVEAIKPPAAECRDRGHDGAA